MFPGPLSFGVRTSKLGIRTSILWDRCEILAEVVELVGMWQRMLMPPTFLNCLRLLGNLYQMDNCKAHTSWISEIK